MPTFSMLNVLNVFMHIQINLYQLWQDIETCKKKEGEKETFDVTGKKKQKQMYTNSI